MGIYSEFFKKNAQGTVHDNTSGKYSSFFEEKSKENNSKKAIQDFATLYNDWAKEASAYQSTYAKRFGVKDYGKSYVADSADAYASAKTAYDSLLGKTRQMQDLMKQYGSYWKQNGLVTDGEDGFSALTNHISNSMNNFSKMQSAYQQDNDYWSQFDSEEAFSQYQADMKKDKELRAFDIAAGETEVAALEKKLSDFLRLENERKRYEKEGLLSIYANEGTYQKAMQELSNAGYGSADELKDAIGRKKVTINQARKKQEPTKWKSEMLADQNAQDYIKKAADFTTVNDTDVTVNPDSQANASAHLPSEIAYMNDVMTNEERDLALYLFGSGRTKEGQAYLDTIHNDLSRRKAEQRFETYSGNTALEMLNMFETGLSQAGNIIDVLKGKNAYGEYNLSDSDYLSSYIKSDLEAREGKFLNFLYDAGSTTIAQAPYIALSLVPGGQVLSPVAMGINAGAGTYKEDINAGYTEDDALLHGSMTAVLEGGLQYLLGGMGKGAGKLSKPLTSKISKGLTGAITKFTAKHGGSKLWNAVKPTFSFLANRTGSALSEGFEESLQAVLDPYVRNIALGDEIGETDWSEVAYNGLMGMFSAMVLNGVGDVANTSKTYSIGKDILKSENAQARVKRLAELGKNASMDSVAYKLANKVDENTGAYTIGRLVREVGGVVTEQNTADIKKGLVRRGVSENDADTISTWLEAVVNSGKILNSRKRAVLENNEVVNDVYFSVMKNQNHSVQQRTNAYTEAVSIEEAAQEPTATEKTTPNIQDPAEIAQKIEQFNLENGIDLPVKIPSQNQFSVSPDGATKVDGQTVQILGLSNENPSVVRYKGKDGTVQEADADKVEYSSEAQSVIAEMFPRLDVPGSMLNNVADSIMPGQAPSDYVLDWAEVYHYGKNGYDFANVGTLQASKRMYPEQLKAAYDMGRASKETQSAKPIIEQNKKTSLKSANEIFGEKGGAVSFNEITESDFKTKTQKAGLQAARLLAITRGIKFEFYKAKTDANGRPVGDSGWYDPTTNTIHVDITAGLSGKNTVLYTMSHELVHWMKANNPRAFKEMADWLLENYKRKDISLDYYMKRHKEKYRAEYPQMIESKVWEYAFEEVVAESCETLLRDGRLLEKLQTKAMKNQNWVKKCISWIKEFLQDLKAAYANINPDSPEGELVINDKAFLDGLIERFDRAFSDGAISNHSKDDIVRQQARDYIETTTDGVVKLNDGSLAVYIDSSASGLSDIPKSQWGKTVANQIRENLAGKNIITIDGDIIRVTKQGANEIYWGTATKELINDAKSNNDFAKVDRKFLTAEQAATVISLSQYSRWGRNIKGTKFGNPFFKDGFNYRSVTVVIDGKSYRYEVVTALNNNIKDKGNYGEKFYDIKESEELSAKTYGEALEASSPYKIKYANSSSDMLTIQQKNRIVKQKQENSSYESAGNNSKSSMEIAFENAKKFQSRDYGTIGDVDVSAELAKDNAKLKKDNEYLRKLVGLTGGQYYTKTSLGVAASDVMKQAGVLRGKDQVQEMLEGLYRYIAKGGEVTFEEIMRRSRNIAIQMQDMKPKKETLDPYSEQIRKELRARRISLTDTQRQEAEYLYGSVQNYRKQNMGRFNLTNDGMSLDSVWVELSQLYPGTFDPDINEGDMVSRLVEIYESTKETVPDYFEQEEEIRRLSYAIYDSYWRVNTLYTKSDRLQKEINLLKTKHNQQMQALRDGAKTRQEKIKKAYIEQRRNDVLRRKKTFVRHQIIKRIKALNHLLEHGGKQRNIKLEIQPTVKAALQAAEKAVDLNGDGSGITDYLKQITELYADLKNDDKYSNIYDEAVADKLKNLSNDVKDKPYRFMTVEELDKVRQALQMVHTVVWNSNRLFKTTKQEFLNEYSNRVTQEMLRYCKEGKIETDFTKKQHLKKAKQGLVNLTIWDNLEPLRAFQKIGSEAFTDLYWNLVEGQNIAAQDYQSAKDTMHNLKEKYGYKEWKHKKPITIETNDGARTVTLAQLLSIYAYSRRRQALEHIKTGGFKVPGTSISDIFHMDTGKLSKAAEKLTEEQRGYVQEMQAYLTEVGSRCNEVSMELYGIEIFKEAVYFPIEVDLSTMSKGSQDHSEHAIASLKNMGVTKEVQKKAANPIYLQDFGSVWSNHCKKMADYHGLVLPIEDLSRVFGKADKGESGHTSVRAIMEDVWGSGAVKYINQLLNDLNGGSKSKGQTEIGKLAVKSLATMKKTATMASLSTAIQQPTAIIRAMSEIDAKYFFHLPNLNPKQHMETWRQIQKYAPVAILKEMGRFDIAYGASTAAWIEGETTLMDKGDDFWGFLAQHGDIVGWNMIWRAVCREVSSTNQYASGSEKFYEACGKRFTQVIVKTQVYDSVLSRSANMRSESAWSKMATSFMGEPTKCLNMVVDAVTQAKRGEMSKVKATKTIGMVYLSTVAAAIASSFIYALRDDDEDSSYVEKYGRALGGKLREDLLNPLNYFPYLRDISSAFGKFSPERSDLSPIADIAAAIKGINSESKSGWEKTEEVSGAFANLFDVPLKNVLRDAKALIAIYTNLTDDKTGHFKEAFAEAILGKDYSKSERLYNAYLSGDKTLIAYAESKYDNRSKIETALRKELRESDERVYHAAIARSEGDIRTYVDIANEIIADGFSQDIVVKAIRSEIDAMNPADDSQETDDEAQAEETVSYFDMQDVYDTMEAGGDATQIINELVEVKVANNASNESKAKKVRKAKSSIRSSITRRWKEQYQNAWKANNSYEMERIRKMLVNTGLYTAGEANSTGRKWIQELRNK